MQRPPEACDFCGAARVRGERLRLVWHSGLGGELVLADLCRRCAAQADRLLEVYGGHGRGAIRLTRASPVARPAEARLRRLGGAIVRGLVYVLIALATFVLFTFVSSHT